MLFGALKPKVDLRDYKIAASAQNFPATFEYKDLPPVKNQRNVSACVAFATAAILELFNKEETGTFIPLSTDFIYGMQGVIFNRLEEGMYLRDACKIVQEKGDAPESIICGNTEQPKCTEELKLRLNQRILDEAKKYKIKSYAKCKTENDIKYALMNYGPVLACIKWYDRYSLDNKIITFDTSTSFGYHATMIYGWNEQGWLCQNSWGRNWNKNGRFIYPFSNKFAEAWSFVDEKNEDVYKPKSYNNNLFDYIYKIFNSIINLFQKR